MSVPRQNETRPTATIHFIFSCYIENSPRSLRFPDPKVLTLGRRNVLRSATRRQPGKNHLRGGASHLSEHKQPEAASGDDRRQYVNFGFHKVDPAWRRLPAEERQRGKQQFIEVVKSFEKDVM